MTISQKRGKYQLKPLKIAFSTLFLTTCTLLTVSTTSFAADTSPSNSMISTEPATNPTANQSTTTPTTTTSTTQVDSPVVTTSKATTVPANTDKSALPLDQPNMSDDNLINFAVDTARAAYSYDFKNYSKQLQANQQNFTGPGWTAFTTALEKSNNLKVVQNKKLVASAILNGKPVIIRKEVRNGIFTWQVQIPLLATYENDSRIIKQNLLVNMLITRSNNLNGIGVSHFVAIVIPGSQPVTTPAVTNDTGVPGPTTPTGNAITNSPANNPAAKTNTGTVTTPSTTTSPSTRVGTVITTPTTTPTTPATTTGTVTAPTTTGTIKAPATPSTGGSLPPSPPAGQLSSPMGPTGQPLTPSSLSSPTSTTTSP